jgi:hypothetical protein
LAPVRPIKARSTRDQEKMRESSFLLFSFDLKNKKLPTITKPKIIHDPPVHRRIWSAVRSYSKYTSVPKYPKKKLGNNGTKIATGIAQAKVTINNFLRFLVKIP